jgi:hypothetical protein
MPIATTTALPAGQGGCIEAEEALHLQIDLSADAAPGIWRSRSGCAAIQ